MSYSSAYNIDDLKQLAQRRLPRVAWDYLERGAEDDVTMRANRSGFERIRFMPRTLVDVSGRTLKHELFGKSYTAPFGIAPTGAAGLYCFDADVALAQAASDAGVPFVLSTASFVAMERVAREAEGTKWFQLYMSKDREAAERLVRRAFDAGFEALVVTTDVPVGANREYNLRNGFAIPFRINARNVIDGMLHPRWLAQVFLRTLFTSGVPRFQNVDSNVGGRIIAKDLSAFRARRDALDWSDIAWLRTIWPRKLLVKGILAVADAHLALRHGADGIIVSNHGGRQLDGAVAAIDVLPAIADAVGSRMPVLFDSGVRRGSDIVKALALGADFVFTGRATLYGAAAGGRNGVAHALGLLRAETDRVMALIGCSRVDELSRAYLEMPDSA
ncbi:MAG: alpha-hydroxy-acid oxidizing protein [Betaproteobacteria bacterium]|nr:alpha-hydroxy-acid oxidizing protein [Betaproteobacteria bacterium]MDH4293159.1 alpha-hydroxy-acid oxidizing protein [Betaproteobacteria bacterium]